MLLENKVAQPVAEVGAPVLRIEDRALVTGAGSFVDDANPAGTLVAHVLRSAVSHAAFTLANLEAARRHGGVRLVLTHADIAGLGSLPMRNAAVQPDGTKPVPPPHPVLAAGTVRHVGEPLAFIVADDLDAAKDAAELIEVSYGERPVVTEARAALETGAPVLHAGRGSNLAYEYHLGDAAAVDAAFAGAARVARVHLVNNRIGAAFVETRGVVAEYDRVSGRYTLRLGCQNGHMIRKMLATEILKIDEARIRVIVPDVGGAFGTKIFTYPEYPLAALAAERLGRPVKWIGERIEHFLADTHGRDQDSFAEMAMDAAGRFLALRVDTVCNVGAYCSENAAFGPYGGVRMVPGCYDVPVMFARVRGAYTNTMPVDAYRGAGRPEASYLIERLVEACGEETGLGPLAIRRLNFVRTGQMPYKSAGNWTFDTGDYAGNFDRALEVADHRGFAARAEAAAQAGRLRGIGVAAHIDACAPPGVEPATVTLGEDGVVTLLIGTQTGGQGHATSYAQFLVGALGVDYDRVRVVQGDTDAVKTGGGTVGSRTMALGGVSVDRAARVLAGKLKRIAAGLLEAPVETLELRGGYVWAARTNRAVGLGELARAAANPADLTATEGVELTDRTFPNGVNIAEVEIDPETGATEVVAFTVVDDFGFVVNPLLLAGQVHGGLAQGIGQALMEGIRYDENGQLLTASFQDYCVPRADNLPDFRLEMRNIPGKTNPLGIKGAGEAGCIGSCPATMNAVADALRRAGVTAWIDMPATPHKVWALLNEKRN